MSKDYYKILGVTEFDSSDEIKIAYRKLARKFHPDIAGDSKEAVLRFKEINEAYEILSNQVKKSEYDRARKFYNYAYNNNNNSKKTDNYTSSPQANTKSFSFNWDEFWGKKTNNQDIKKNVKAPKDGVNVTTDVEINAFEAFSGVTKVINMLQTNICPKCQGKKFVNNSTCVHCNGKGELNSYKKFTVKIPAGVKNGAKIRLAGEGTKGINGGKNGDLYIIIHVQESKNYRTEGLNIYRTIPITPFEAVLGTNVKISGLDGVLNVKIGANTQNGQKIRLANCGIVQNNKIGDMIITVEIKIPKNLTEEELLLYKKLAEISTCNIRNEI
ncbi:DnaJ domain-containing protein [bacterium]|nr:DnaJ domain-containing protein [bacterium]